MVYNPGIDWVEKIQYEFPEVDWGIDCEVNEADDYCEYCAYVDCGWLPNCYSTYNSAAKAIYDYLKENEDAN